MADANVVHNWDKNGFRFFGIFNSMSQIADMNVGWMAVLNTGTRANPVHCTDQL